MKTKIQNHLFLFLAVACATKAVKENSKVPPQTTPSSPTVPSSTTILDPLPQPVTTLPVPQITAPVNKAPILSLPDTATEEMRKAEKLYSEYANSDELFEYIKANVPKTLEGGNETDRDVAIKKTRDCLNKLGIINVRYRNYGVWPFYKSAAQGGWDGFQINQNPRHYLDEVEQAGFFFHETTHACGFSHISNNITLFPIIRKSWPYASGYAFEDFVTEKRKATLASGDL